MPSRAPDPCSQPLARSVCPVGLLHLARTVGRGLPAPRPRSRAPDHLPGWLRLPCRRRAGPPEPSCGRLSARHTLTSRATAGPLIARLISSASEAPRVATSDGLLREPPLAAELSAAAAVGPREREDPRVEGGDDAAHGIKPGAGGEPTLEPRDGCLVEPGSPFQGALTHAPGLARLAEDSPERNERTLDLAGVRRVPHAPISPRRPALGLHQWFTADHRRCQPGCRASGGALTLASLSDPPSRPCFRPGAPTLASRTRHSARCSGPASRTRRPYRALGPGAREGPPMRPGRIASCLMRRQASPWEDPSRSFQEETIRRRRAFGPPRKRWAASQAMGRLASKGQGGRTPDQQTGQAQAGPATSAPSWPRTRAVAPQTRRSSTGYAP